jgi:hypothetical protein
MAEEKDTGFPVAVVKESELAASFSGPAFHSNRFIVTSHTAGMRIAFLEQGQTSDAEPSYRAAVVISYADAIELKNLLASMLEPLEAQLTPAKKYG